MSKFDAVFAALSGASNHTGCAAQQEEILNDFSKKGPPAVLRLLAGFAARVADCLVRARLNSPKRARIVAPTIFYPQEYRIPRANTLFRGDRA